MRALKLFFWVFPWLIAVICGLWFWQNWSEIELFPKKEAGLNETHHTILERMITIGKLELIKYRFQEITEIEKVGRDFYNLFKLENDSRAVLISSGEAVGCIDLTLMEVRHIRETADSVIIQLPPPELCYFKLDLENTRIYAVETGLFTSEREFIEEAYKSAEKQIRQAALQSGILKQARDNAEIVLKPLLEEISGKKVVIVYDLNTVRIRRD
jgi:hypothetical protein